MSELEFDISYEEMRSLVIDNLASSSKVEINSLHDNIAKSVVEKKIALDPYANSETRYANQSYKLKSEHKNWIHDIIWDLIVEGIIRPDNSLSSHYHVSEYGKGRLTTPPQPYDPDGYLKRVKEIDNVDEIIVTYLEESLKAFRIHCLLSSVITLGCASEKAILLAIDACNDALSSQNEKDDFIKKTDTISIKRKHETFLEIFQTKIESKLSYEIKENLEHYLYGLFSIIRTHRNDAGHPSGKVIKREELYTYLVTFPSYLEKVYSLIDWLKTNSI